MKNIFTIILMLVTLSVNAQWVVQTSGVTSDLYDVEFINRYTGWACGNGGKILKTTNGGINWINIPNPSNIGGGNLVSIFPVDSLYCYVTGGYNIILKTTNGGSSWIEISNGPLLTGSYNGVHFLNRDTGWFCRGGGFVLRTTNGGVTFDSAQAPSFCNDMYFRNFNEGLYCGGHRVYKTTNSGMNWFNTNVPANYAYEFVKLSIANNQYVYLIAGTSPLYRSTDFCNTWQVLDTLHSYPPSVMYCCAFSSINTGWAGGSYGYLYKTTNGGINFYRQNTGTDQRFWGSIYCFNDSVVWGVGGAGKIMHTTTSGQWLVDIQNISTEIPSKYSLSQNYPNPFNPVTKIRFDVPSVKQASLLVALKVYDVMGREVQTLVNESLKPGTYEVTFNIESATEHRRTFGSGVYFYKLTTDGFTETKKMLMIK